MKENYKKQMQDSDKIFIAIKTYDGVLKYEIFSKNKT